MQDRRIRPAPEVVRHLQSELRKPLSTRATCALVSTTSPYDHFALPGDNLAAAKREGRLRRNFQGYTDDAGETDKKNTVYRFGSELRYRFGNASSTLSISRVEPT